MRPLARGWVPYLDPAASDPTGAVRPQCWTAPLAQADPLTLWLTFFDPVLAAFRPATPTALQTCLRAAAAAWSVGPGWISLPAGRVRPAPLSAFWTQLSHEAGRVTPALARRWLRDPDPLFPSQRAAYQAALAAGGLPAPLPRPPASLEAPDTRPRLAGSLLRASFRS